MYEQYSNQTDEISQQFSFYGNQPNTSVKFEEIDYSNLVADGSSVGSPVSVEYPTSPSDENSSGDEPSSVFPLKAEIPAYPSVQFEHYQIPQYENQVLDHFQPHASYDQNYAQMYQQYYQPNPQQEFPAIDSTQK